MNKFKLIALLLCSSCFNSGSITFPVKSDLNFELDVLGYLGYNGEVERSGIGVRFEKRDGLSSSGLEIRPVSYELQLLGYAPMEVDGLEIGAPIRHYFTDFGNSAFVEGSPIIGFGLEDEDGDETDMYMLVSLGIGYRLGISDQGFMEVSINHYETLLEAEYSDFPGVTYSIDGEEIIVALGTYF